MKNVLDYLETSELIKQLSHAYEKEDQNLINVYAYALARRLYVQNKEVAFIDLLRQFGYKDKELVLKKEENK